MTRASILLRLTLSALLLIGTVFYFIEAMSFDPLARYVPLLAGGGALIVLSLIVLREVGRLIAFSRGERRSMTQTIEGDAEIEITRAVAIGSVKYVAYMLVLLAAVWQVGLLIAGPTFATLFLWLDSKVGLVTSVITGVAIYGAFWVLNAHLGFQLP